LRQGTTATSGHVAPPADEFAAHFATVFSGPCAVPPYLPLVPLAQTRWTSCLGTWLLTGPSVGSSTRPPQANQAFLFRLSLHLPSGL
jgi:hypothetical protein